MPVDSPKFKRPAAAEPRMKRPAAAPRVESPRVESPKPTKTNRSLDEALQNAAEKEDPANSKKAKKGQPSKSANVIEEIEYSCGWMAYKYQTQKGREYWKYVRPDGVYYFSLKSATENGLKLKLKKLKARC